MYVRAGIYALQDLSLKKWWSIWNMPTKDKQRGTWIGRVQKAGFMPKKKRGFKTRIEAVKWEIEETNRLLNPDPIRITFSQSSNDYLAWVERRREQNTFRYKLHIIKSFLKHLGADIAVEDITSQTIEEFLDTIFEASSGKTANRYLRELKTFFNWAVHRDAAQTNPCRPIELYKEDPFIKYVPPVEDLNKVLSLADKWQRNFLLCIFYTAARRIEIIRLKWDDIDFERRLITLWTKKRKGGSLESDQLYINDGLMKVLKSQPRIPDHPYVFSRSSGEPLSKNTVDKLLNSLCKKADVTPFGLHAIRHFAAVVMMDSKELSLVDIQKMLRQKRATTTDVYLNQLSKSKTMAAEILGGVLE
jgi:integrase